MPSLPLIPLYILFDSTTTNKNVLLECIGKLPKYMKTPANAQSRVRLSLVQMGYFFTQPDFQGRCIDLRSAFEHIVFFYRELAKTAGTGNPEILIFLGNEPADGWQATQEIIDSELRGLILSYWFEQGALAEPKHSTLNTLLTKISRWDPVNHHKIIYYQTSDNLNEEFDNIFRKLATRLDQRLSQIGTVTTSQL